MSQARAKAGFTLLEVLIAFAILALSLGAILQAFGTGLVAITRAESHATAALQARSLLAEVGSSRPLEPGESVGDFDDGTLWTVTIEPYQEGDESEALDFGVVLYQVEVAVGDQERDLVTLKTLRVGREP